MPSLTLNALVESLQRFRLLETHQLDELTHSLQGQFPEPAALAAELVRRGWLTPFQAKQLQDGRGQHLVFGPYLIQERIGTGGNGQVFKAWHDALHRLVALKVLRKDLVADAEAVGRFHREVEVLSKVSHPSIVRAYEAGVVGVTHFLAMEYVEGVDLDRLVRKSGRLSVAQACSYIHQAACGLAHAHEQGMVHRDIKPSNLFLTQAHGAQAAGVVKILDLGLARLQEPPVASKTRNLTVLAGNSQMLGTPDYLAPEQALDFHTADIRADIYALGCTFYFLLTAEPPFPGGGLHQKLLRHQQEKPPALEAARDDVPPGLSAIVEKMLAKHPDDRYQTPGEAAQALAALGLAAPGADSAPTVSVPLEKTPASGTQVGKLRAITPALSAVRMSPSRLRGKVPAWATRWYVLAGGALLLIGGVGVVGMLSSGPSPPGTEAPPSRKAAAAKPRGALQFNGDQVVVLPVNLFRNANVLSLEAWFKTTAGGVLFGYQSHAYPDGAGNFVPILYVGTDGLLRGQFWTGQNNLIATSGRVNDGRWHHVCLVADGPAKVQSLYLDGTLAGKAPGEPQHLDMSQNQIGTGRGDGRPASKNGWFGFNGTIAEVRVWYAVRTPEQVRQGMKAALKETEPDLAAYYPMNELEGDNLMDRSGRGRNLLLGLPGNRKQPTRTTDHPTK